MYRNYCDTHFDDVNTAEDGHQPIRSSAFAIGHSAYLQRALVSYALAPGATSSKVAAIQNSLKNGIEQHLIKKTQAGAYRAYMDASLYTWTSHFHKASAGMLALWGLKLNVHPARNLAYRARADSYLHYFHGAR
jgi:hypothetical protein